LDEWIISHYRVRDKLGEGGMGRVYLAKDTRLERDTAIKVLSPQFTDDPERLAQFRREAKTVAALNHPNIVTIYSVEESDQGPLLAMELIRGRTLHDVIPRHGMDIREFFDIAQPMVDALSAAHRGGVTHRDLKPGNVMVGDDGRVKVLDFGLAKLIDEDSISESDTTTGRIMGTVHYMSPEQISGKELDHRSDIFSLGVILYEMATGRRPFRGDSFPEAVHSVLQDIPPPVTELNSRLPRHLARIINLCLEKDPRDRFQSASDVFNVLRGLRAELAPVSGPTSGEISLNSLPGIRQVWSFSPSRFRPHHLVATRPGLLLLLVGVMLLNWVETSAEIALRPASGLLARVAEQTPKAMGWLEGGIGFEFHDVMSTIAVYGCSMSYFFLLPLMALCALLTLARRIDISPLRVFSLAVVLVYLISLPFFIFFPVPERWSYPMSEATLLSDLWSSKLIETIRPMSGLDNCFPSFHSSLTVVITLCCFLFKVRLRYTVLFLGLTVILSTFVLGIHWIPDIVAGIATGILGVFLARRIDLSLQQRL
jgi:serine/threonine protein kinase/membrane-associated phospholipid phosphatase